MKHNRTKINFLIIFDECRKKLAFIRFTYIKLIEISLKNELIAFFIFKYFTNFVNLSFIHNYSNK